MKTIIEQISDVINIPIVNEPSGHVSGQYHRFDDGSAEVEVLNFLYSLVEIAKPTNILETGSYWGYTATCMALALKKNGSGQLDTIEFADINLDKAQKLWKQLDVDDVINPHLINSLEFTTDKQYELVLLDTEPMLRFLELERFWDNIKLGGIIIIHDLSWDLGSGAPQFWLNKELLDKRIKNHELQAIPFFTPRGLNLFYKTRPEDEVYKLLRHD